MACERLRVVLLQIAALAVTLVMASGCANELSGGPIDGKVVEEGTGTPIPGAIVIAQWRGNIGGPVHSNTVCYHLEVVVSGANGEYRIPAWRRGPVVHWETGMFGLRDTEVWLRAYKEGFDSPQAYVQTNGVVLLAPFHGSAQERLNSLASEGTRGCGDLDGSRRYELLLHEAICREAKRIPGADVAVPGSGNRSFLQRQDDTMKHIIDTVAASSSPEPLRQIQCSQVPTLAK